MTESNTEAPADTTTSGDDVASDTPAAPQGNPADGELGDAGKKALDRMKAERNEAAKRARALEQELEKFRQASMSESEKAVAEAEKRGRESAATDFGAQLAHSQFEAAAARRNKDFDTGPALELIDLKRFVGKDGSVDAAAITAAVERLVPEPSTAPPSFDGGARGASGKAPNMNDFIRQQATRRS